MIYVNVRNGLRQDRQENLRDRPQMWAGLRFLRKNLKKLMLLMSPCGKAGCNKSYHIYLIMEGYNAVV